MNSRPVVWLLGLILVSGAGYAVYQQTHLPCVDGSYGTQGQCERAQQLKDCIDQAESGPAVTAVTQFQIALQSIEAQRCREKYG